VDDRLGDIWITPLASGVIQITPLASAGRLLGEESDRRDPLSVDRGGLPRFVRWGSLGRPSRSPRAL
jgi:hypothetical protein